MFLLNKTEFNFGICLYFWYASAAPYRARFRKCKLNVAAVKFGKVHVFLYIFAEGVKHLFNTLNDYLFLYTFVIIFVFSFWFER